MTKLKFILFTLIIGLQINTGLAQPILNARYATGGSSNSIFGSIVSTDSCYYVVGIHVSSPSFYETKSSFIKMNFDGTIDEFTSIENDTMGIDFWEGYNMIPTLDGNFAIMANVYSIGYENAFMFMKIAPNGDVLIANFIYDFYNEREEFGIRPNTLLQESDSTFYGIVTVQRESDLQGGTVFYKLDKNGNLLLNTSFYPPEGTGYHLLKGGSLTKESADVFVIGTTVIDVIEIETADKRHHSKLIRVDKEGIFLDDYTYFEDTLSADVNGLIKTADNGFLYCGRNGKFFEGSGGYHAYKGRIVKLNNEFLVDWTLEIGDFIQSPYLNMTKIIPLNDTELVAVGYTTDIIYEPWPRQFQHGMLIKFNLAGELIWKRKYYKVPHFEGEANYPTHKLYDIEQTTDGGFVMIGQSMNFHENEEPFGQMGWLVKTNAYGCIVPGCQIGDISAENEPEDTIADGNPPKPTEKPITWLYPNPVSSSLFYYHHQDNFQYGTAYIYSPTGEVVQKWEITSNDITYEVDVSQLAAGTYILKVFNMLGEPLQTERFVKI